MSYGRPARTVILLLAVYSLLTNPLLLIALAFLIGVRLPRRPAYSPPADRSTH